MAMARDAHLLSDVRIELRQAALRPVYAVATDSRRVPSRGGVLGDIGVVSGRDNLGQAVILRLLTPLGELAPLGHPEYGSRLHTLIGDRNSDTRRALVRLYILESLALEPRIEEVVEVAVATNPAQRGGVDVLVRVRPVGSQDLVRIGPFTLELET
jgi:phage baseplate assembly protein W